MSDLTRRGARRKLQFDITSGQLVKKDGVLTDALGRYYVSVIKGTGTYAPPVPIPVAPGAAVQLAENVPVSLGYDRTGKLVITGMREAALATMGISPRYGNPLDPAALGLIVQERIAPLLCRPHANRSYFAQVL